MRLICASPLLLITMISIGILGCSADQPEHARIAWRLIDHEPTEAFDETLLIQRSTVFDWRFDDPDEWARWQPVPSGVAPEKGRRTAASWIRTVDFDAESVDAIELWVSTPPTRVQYALSWMTEGRPKRAAHTIRNRLTTAAHGARARIRFDLAGHTGWKGTIARLELRVRTPRGNRRPKRLLRRLVGLRFEPPSAEQRATALDRFWKIDLDGDVRNAMRISAGNARAVAVDVPPRGQLRFALGIQTVSDVPVAVAVDAVGDDLDTTLYSGQLSAGVSAWQPALVDLAALAGRRVSLRFRVLASTEQAAESAPPVVAWAHPEILQSIAAPTSEPPLPHVVLVSLDTLRADHLSLYGYARPTSPHLDAWAERHAGVFLNAVAQAPWTLPSHVSMLTGLDPLRHGVNHDGAVPASVELLAQRLRRAGYTTVAVTGGGFLHPRHGFARGFDRYVYWRRWQHGDGSEADELAEGIRRTLDVIEQNRGEPLFLFFHTYEPHKPYLPREPYFSAFGGEAPEENAPGERLPRLHQLYDSGVAYTDALLQPLLKRVDEMNQRSGPLVVITSDHGEALGDGRRFDHGHLFDDTILVPLVIRTPTGIGAGLRIRQQVRSVDIVPTVLELAGLPPATDLDGWSLVDLLRGRPMPPGAPFEQAWSYSSKRNRGLALRQGNRLKYVLDTTAWTKRRSRERLFDLERDPREQTNLASDMDTASFEEMALAAIGRAPGLRMRIVDASPPGAPPLAGELRGQAVQRTRVEQVGALCRCLEWLGHERARFALDPGQTLDLLFEEVAGRELTLSVSSDRGPSFETTLVLDELDAPRSLSRLGQDEWTWTEQTEGDRIGWISVWWQGRPSRPSADPLAGWNSAAESLKALGYL